MSKSYKDVLNKTYPAYNDNIDNLLYGGTDHDINGNDSVTALSYGVNEDISFVFYLKGDYILNWQIDKDNAADNLYGSEEANGTVVASGEHNPAEKGYVFKYTTQMKQAGVVRFTGKLVNAATGKTVTTFYASAAADFANITQSLEEGLDEDGVKALVDKTKGYYDTWSVAWDIQAATVDTDAAAAWLANDNEAGVEYVEDGKLMLKVAEKGDTYTSYYFWIATGSEGLNTEVDQNERPATGVFSVPKDATGLNISASFRSWDSDPVSTGAPGNTLAVRVLNHGKPNGSTIDLDAAATSDDPTQVFAYGVLKRDYIAVQVAKKLFADVLNDNASVTTYGGSAGGWQAVAMAALDEDVNSVSTRITWMCSLGAHAAGDITCLPTGFHPADCAGTSVFSTVTAARIVNERVAESGNAFTFTITGAGLGDYQASPPHGVIALYNAFTADNVTKSAKFAQYQTHSGAFYGSLNKFEYSLFNK